MTDPLDDRLASFGADEAAPALRPAAEVRARGVQRRARTRTALAGAGAAVLLLAGGGAYAVLAPDRAAEVLDVADPSPSPVPSDRVTEVLPAALLLQPEDARRISGGGWVPSLLGPDAVPFLAPCEGPRPRAEAGASHALSQGDTAVFSQVLRFEGRAQDVLSQLAADVRRCPSRPEEPGSDAVTLQFDLQGGPVTDSVAVRIVRRACASCEGTLSQFVVLAGGDGLVAYVGLPDTEREQAPVWAEAARSRMEGRSATGASPSASPSDPPAAPTAARTAAPTATRDATGAPRATPSPTSADPRDLTRVVLDVGDADRAEPGDWRRDGFADEGPPLDPCPGGTRYPRDADRTGEASTILQSSREAGGTFLVHQVGSYPSEGIAEDAAADRLRAVQRCRTSPGTGPEGGTVTYEVLGTATVEGARTTYVRRTSSCDTCVGGYTYYAVQQRGDLLSVLLVEHGEDGDPGRDVIEPFAREAAERLARAARG